MTPNRIVAMLTPAFALAAGACATWLADHFPGINVSSDALEEIFIAGALAVLVPAFQWLKGWQEHEKREFEAMIKADQAAAGIPDVAVSVTNEEAADETTDEAGVDFEDLDLGEDEGTDELAGLDELMEDEEPVVTGR